MTWSWTWVTRRQVLVTSWHWSRRKRRKRVSVWGGGLVPASLRSSLISYRFVDYRNFARAFGLRTRNATAVRSAPCIGGSAEPLNAEQLGAIMRVNTYFFRKRLEGNHPKQNWMWPWPSSSTSPRHTSNATEEIGKAGTSWTTANAGLYCRLRFLRVTSPLVEAKSWQPPGFAFDWTHTKSCL